MSKPTDLVQGMTRLAVLLCVSTSLLAQQAPDPNFPVKVANPAYREKGPVVAIDATHNNVHTADGGYKTFAGLISSDGYFVRSNIGPFQPSTLKEAHILVIANARGSASGPIQNRATPAFTPEENDAVQDWVRGGGALLLIADHWPMVFTRAGWPAVHTRWNSTSRILFESPRR